MGACQSTEDVTAATNLDEEEADPSFCRQQTTKINVQTGEEENFDPAEQDEADFFFEVEEDVELDAKEFMAVKPWIGAVKEPDDHPPVEKEKPEGTYVLDHVYGYRASDSRQNVYYNPDGKVCYMTACLGVILNPEDNHQQFFGGHEVENVSKQVASDMNHHTNDIMCMSVNTTNTREWAVTGQVGKSPSVHVWSTLDGAPRAKFNLPRNARGVKACAISHDGSYVAVADLSNDHWVTVFETDGGKVWTQKGGTSEILDMTFNKTTSDAEDFCLWTGGVKHFCHWNVKSQESKKGLWGDHPRTSFGALAADDQGRCYAGGSNALIYVYRGRSIVQTLGFHGKGFIGALNWNNGQLFSGGKDGRVNVINTEDMTCVQTWEVGCLIRAIDISPNGENIVIGRKDGTISVMSIADGTQSDIMKSHNDGEVWGLTQTGSTIYSSGDDNQVLQYDPTSKCVTATFCVNEAVRKAKKNKASTMGKMPESQASRGLASSEAYIAVCANDGSVTIRSTEDPGAILHELQDADEWVEVAEFSPDGAHLAVGSHDTNIYIYETEGFSLIGKCEAHRASLTCIDWSMDSTYIRSVCNAYELLFFQIPDCSQDQGGASSTTGTMWVSQHCKFGWLVDGIFPKGTDGTHINGVDMNEDQSLIACGDDFGLVQVFRNPARKGCQPRSYQGHSEHVVRVKFGRGDLNNFLFTIGGYD